MQLGSVCWRQDIFQQCAIRSLKQSSGVRAIHLGLHSLRRPGPKFAIRSQAAMYRQTPRSNRLCVGRPRGCARFGGSDQVHGACPVDGIFSGGDVEFAVDGPEVGFHGVDGKVEVGGDFAGFQHGG